MVKCKMGKTKVEGQVITIIFETETIVESVAKLLKDFPESIKCTYREHITNAIAKGFDELEEEKIDRDEEVDELIDKLIDALMKEEK